MTATSARLILRSGNDKTGTCAVTYVSIAASCPSCPLRDDGCYGQLGRLAPIGAKLDATGATSARAARDEAREIRYWAARAEPGTPLRLHVFGDCRSASAARTVSSAAERWPGPVWTYTHAWRDVPRRAWGSVSVLASMEDPRDAKRAMRAGYAPACVVAEHPADGRAWEAHGVTWIPCPEQTRGVRCVECRLCWDAEALRKRAHGIAFAAHGQRRAKTIRHLPVLS